MRHLLAKTILCATLTATLWGCEDPKITPEQASPFVDAWLPEVGPSIKEQASSSATSEAVRLRAEQARADAADAKGMPFDAIIEEVYATRGHKPAFIQGGKLTKPGQSIADALRRVTEDGFDPAPFEMTKVDAKLKELETLSTEYASLGSFEPGDKERAFALSYVTTQKPDEFKFTEDKKKLLTQKLLESPAGKGLLDMKARYEDVGKRMAGLEAQIELTLARGLARYAFKLKHHRIPVLFLHPRHDDRYNMAETRGKRPTGPLGGYKAGLIERKAHFIADKFARKNEVKVLSGLIRGELVRAVGGDAAGVLTSLSPGPQYEGLKKERLRYQKIVAAGGWASVPVKRKLKRGARGAVVQKLKKRLQLEGYYPADAPVDEVFGAGLEDAVKAYQRTHQYKVDGKLSKSLWGSINASAKRRLGQIEFNMKRWRKSDVRHHDAPTYILVNIPDFTAEIWKEQKRAKRMRVVVGNNDRTKDEETGKTLFNNRTPLLSAYVDRVIYNPFWNVTPRIRSEEILVDVRKDLEPRYKAKMLKLLGVSAKPKPTLPDPTGLMTPPTPTVPDLFRKSREGVVFDIAAYKTAYTAKAGAEPDLKAQFPYLDPATGLINVNTTDPTNVPPWYAAEGYEVMYPGKKWEYVRQLNGDKNSLGRVKIIFPNLHDVYLHDTPKKGLFKNPIRAYSHGCMRMHKPLDFAAWLLKNDDQYETSKIKRLLSKTQFEPIFLKKRVPVHVVYHTVRVDDEGRANFLADIYKRDATNQL